MELTVTSATIALASKSFQFLSTDEDVLSKPRDSRCPIQNPQLHGLRPQMFGPMVELERRTAAKLSDGEECHGDLKTPHLFVRHLTPEGHGGMVGVKLEGSGFDSVSRIPVIREGETVYDLKPKQENVLHRLLVEVKLGQITSSTSLSDPRFWSRTTHRFPLRLGVFSPEEGHLFKIEKIPPGDARPAPVGSAYLHSLVIRPDQGFGYDWSNERLFWKDLLKRPTQNHQCVSERGQQAPPFYFQMHATYDKKDSYTGDVSIHEGPNLCSCRRSRTFCRTISSTASTTRTQRRIGRTSLERVA